MIFIGGNVSDDEVTNMKHLPNVNLAEVCEIPFSNKDFL